MTVIDYASTYPSEQTRRRKYEYLLTFTGLDGYYSVHLARSQNVSKLSAYSDTITTSTSTNMFPSKIPAEIRNAIYEILTANYLPICSACEMTHDLLYKVLVHLQPDPRTVKLFGGLPAINKQLRAEFAPLLKVNASSISFENMTDFFDTFYAAQCLARRCKQDTHSPRPKESRVTIPDRVSPRTHNLTALFVAKAWTPSLSLYFEVVYSHHAVDASGKDLSDTLMNILDAVPPRFIGDVKSGLISDISELMPRGRTLASSTLRGF